MNTQQFAEDPLVQLAADMLGVPARSVPAHWVFRHSNSELARAATIKNCLVALQLHNTTSKIDRGANPWHAEYADKPRDMVRALIFSGLLGPQVAN